MRDFAKYLGGFLLAVLLLWWVLGGTEPSSVWRELKRASLAGVLISATLNLGHNVFRAWRWRALLAPIRPGVAFRPMFSAIMVGYMTSWVIPGRLGELVRPLLLSAREKVPLGPCLGTVVADRLFDGITVAALFVVGSWVTPLEGKAAEYGPLIRSGSLTMAALVGVVTAGMLLASSAGERFHGWIGRRPRAIRWLGRSVVAISSGVSAVRSPRLLIQVLLYSLLAWLTIAASIWFGVRAVGAEVSIGAVLVILPLLVLGVAVPTPGGAGSYHGAMKVGLMLFGTSEIVAVSAGFLMHALIVFPVILVGMVLIWIDKISWKDLVASATQIRNLGSIPKGPEVERVVENMT